MKAQTNQRTAQHETSLRALLREEIEDGIDVSRDPVNAGLPDLFARTTTIYSPWYTRTCPECKHKFREGDRVRLCPKCGQAYHDDDQYNLHCWQIHFADDRVCRDSRSDPITGVMQPGCDCRWSGFLPGGSEGTRGEAQSVRRIGRVTTQFLDGLEAVWKPYGDQAVLKVPEGHSIVGHKCPWCRFQIRTGDRVVRCPCGKCDTYFHDDIFRHLTCWNDWNGTRGNDYCPTTGARIERTPTEGE